MTIAPTITLQTDPGLAVDTNIPGVPYSAILQELGITVFFVETLYYNASSSVQFSNPIQYLMYESNGNLRSFLVLTPISPAQFQASLFVPMAEKGIVIDGQTGFVFNMNAGQQIQFIVYAERKRNQDDIDNAGYINNFKSLESAMGRPWFFED